MKFKKALPLLAIVFTIAGSFMLGVQAASGSEPITAYVGYDIGVQYDGQSVTLKNANGERVFPILYEGSTYVPIRAISNLFGVPVEWDAATRSVLLGTSTSSPGIDLEPIRK